VASRVFCFFFTNSPVEFATIRSSVVRLDRNLGANFLASSFRLDFRS